MEASFSGNTLCSEGHIEEIKFKSVTKIFLECSSRTLAPVLKAYNIFLAFKVRICIRVAIIPGLHYVGLSLCYK
jgi:hypothetical protein